MNKHYTYLANWKMNLPFNEALKFISGHYDDFVLLSKKPHTQIVICPSTETLYPIHQMLKGTDLELSAQDCSKHARGSFTGQVCAPSLKQAGCKFCIIGHSEQRLFGCDTNEGITHKCATLLDVDITPVVCIGENLEQYKNGTTLEALNTQLNPLFTMLTTHQKAHVPIFLAYEPIWAIGSGKVATNEHIETILSWLAKETSIKAPSFKWKLLYGGSVNAKNIGQLKTIALIDGFLIGGASLDFEEFEKVVNYV